MRLINTTTGAEVKPGDSIRHQETGARWKFSHVTHHPDGHRVHACRPHRRLGKVPGQFHPRVFGLEVVVNVGWKGHVRNVLHVSVAKFDDYLLAGIIALVPLGLFEQLHGAEYIGELFGLGGH